MRNISLPLLALLVAMPAAAQPIEIGDLAGFNEALKSMPAPAAVPTRPAEPLATTAVRPAGCAVLALAGATVGRGLFESEYTVKIADREVGKVSAQGRALTYTPRRTAAST